MKNTKQSGSDHVQEQECSDDGVESEVTSSAPQQNKPLADYQRWWQEHWGFEQILQAVATRFNAKPAKRHDETYTGSEYGEGDIP